MTRSIIPLLLILITGIRTSAQYAGNTHPRTPSDTSAQRADGSPGKAANARTPGSAGQRGTPAKAGPAIRVLARAKKHSILLRWAVNTPAAWKISNQYGFRIERYTVLRNNKMLATPEKSLLSPGPILPKPLQEWESIVKNNNYAAVMAQAIYGKDFELTGGDDKGIAKMINRSNELDQRFIMSLYAADNSFEAACQAGWGWEDSTVKWNEKYLYRVFSLVPAGLMHIDSASVYISTSSSFEALPIPGNIAAVFGDRSVMLSWDCSSLKSYYHSYIVEKSEDGGKSFHPLSDLPVANLNNKEKRPSTRMYLIDSLKDNQTLCQYRVKGITPFGEQGAPSQPVQGKGKSLLTYVPHIRKTNVDERGIMSLEWEFEESGNALIKGFVLRRSDAANGVYKTVLEDIAPDRRQLNFDKLAPGNYFTITALAKEGGDRTSFPVLVQLVDSIPPAPPVGLEGTIDSNGQVVLTWKPNTETDLLGYKVFKANNRGEELSVLTDSIYSPTTYRDKVSLKTINNKLYYAVAALDKRYNQSRASAVIEIKKPDRIPPASPIITTYKVVGNAIWLNWVNSTDPDVAAHYLYRKEGTDSREGADSGTQWLLVARFTDTTHEYTDDKVTGGKTYSYRIAAKDSSGLESPPVPPLAVALPQDPTEMAIRSLNAYVDRDHRYIEISWTDNLPDVQEYQLYRGVNGKLVTLWKIVRQEHKRIVDEGVSMDTNYEYGIRALMRGGAMGPYKKIEVKY